MGNVHRLGALVVVCIVVYPRRACAPPWSPQVVSYSTPSSAQEAAGEHDGRPGGNSWKRWQGCRQKKVWPVILVWLVRVSGVLHLGSGTQIRNSRTKYHTQYNRSVLSSEMQHS